MQSLLPARSLAFPSLGSQMRIFSFSASNVQTTRSTILLVSTSLANSGGRAQALLLVDLQNLSSISDDTNVDPHYQGWRHGLLIAMLVMYSFNMLFAFFGVSFFLSVGECFYHPFFLLQLAHCYMVIVGQTTRGNIKNDVNVCCSFCINVRESVCVNWSVPLSQTIEKCTCSTAHYAVVCCGQVSWKYSIEKRTKSKEMEEMEEGNLPSLRSSAQLLQSSRSSASAPTT